MAAMIKGTRPQWIVVATIIFTLTALILNSILAEDVPFQRAINYLLYILPLACAILILIQTTTKTKFKPENGLIYCIMTGYGLYFLAILFHVLIGEFTGYQPNSSAFYHWLRLASFVLIIIGWFFNPIMQRREMLRLKLLLDISITTGALLLITWVLFLQPYNRNLLANPQPWQWLKIHPILDIAVAAIIVNMLLLNPNRTTRIMMGIFAAAMLFIMASDISISTSSSALNQTMSSGIDFGLLIAGCCLFIGSFLLSRKLPQDGADNPLEQPWALGLQIQSTLPIALPITLAVILTGYWIQNQIVTQTVIGFSAMIWLLLIARLGVSAGEFELQQYYFLYNNSTEPAFLCNRNQELILVNPAMIQLFKASDESDLLRRPLQTLLAGKLVQEIRSEIHHETEIHCCDGTTLLVDLSLKPILLGIFKRKLITGAIHDLTIVNQQREELQTAYQRLSDVMRKVEGFNLQLEKRVQEKTSSLSLANEELAAKNKKLESLDQLKSDFVSLVSHELRAPLTNISGGMELVLSEKNRISSSDRQSLKLVQQEIRRLTRFVESILDLSALDAGRMPLYPEPLDMGPIIRELQNQFNRVPGSERIKWQFPAIIPPVLADSRALYSIIFHLMDNALKYAPEGEVVFSVLPEMQKVFFMVQDRGPGVPFDQMDFIFEDFYRGNPADSQSVYGHGLGLYIVSRFLQAMDGSIEVSNRPGGGAEFRCWLPIMEMDHETENSSS